MEAKDIMIQDMITVRSTTTVEEIALSLSSYRIGGVPVVEDGRRIVGIVKEHNLFQKKKAIPFSAVNLLQLVKQWIDRGKLAEISAGALQHKASDVMMLNPIFVGPEEEIGHVAWRIARFDLKRVPVVNDGVLVDIMTRADISRRLARGQEYIDVESQGRERFVAGR